MQTKPQSGEETFLKPSRSPSSFVCVSATRWATPELILYLSQGHTAALKAADVRFCDWGCLGNDKGEAGMTGQLCSSAEDYRKSDHNRAVPAVAWPPCSPSHYCGHG